MPTYYKVLDEHAAPYHGGTGVWHKPRRRRPGKWMPEIANIKPCERGYHLVTVAQLPDWLGPTIWTAEGSGDHIDDGAKHVFARARLLTPIQWDLATCKWWALECLEHALPLYEKQHPKDARPRTECALVRRFLNDEISLKEYHYSSSFFFSLFSFFFSLFSFFFSFSFSSSERTWRAQHLAERLGLAWDVSDG